MGEQEIKRLALVMLMRHLFSGVRTTGEGIIMIRDTEYKEFWEQEENQRLLLEKDRGGLSRSDVSHQNSLF